MQIRSKKSVMEFCLVGLLLAAESICAEPVAIITDLQGSAKIQQSSEFSDISILDNLEAESSVVIAADNSLTLVYYESGVEYAYTGPVSFVVGVAKPELVSGDAGRSKELKLLESTGLKPAERNLNQAATVFRNIGGSDGKIELLSPVNTKMIETSPVFKWVALDENASYDFVLRSSRGQTVFQSTATQNEVQLPAGNELRYGRKYNWELTATSGSEQYRASASFRMGTESDIKKLSQLQPDAGASFSEKIVYTLLLKQAGFKYAAQQAWKSLEQERPEHAKTNTLFE